jgi:hypothetical protein
LWPELADRLRGQHRGRQMSAPATPSAVASIFGDVRRHRRQFCHLMAPRLAELIAGAQQVLAVATDVRRQLDHRVHARWGDKRARIARMPALATRFAPTLDPATANPLPAGQAIGAGWLRRGRRILLAQRELTFQIFNLAGLIGELLRSIVQFPTQALILAPEPLQFLRTERPSIAMPSPWLHWPERTELRQRVQEV